MFRRKQNLYAPKRRFPRRLLYIGIVLFAILVIGSMLVHHNYSKNLRPVSDNTDIVYVTIATGTSASDIGELLEDKNLIRDAQAFEWYISSHNQRDKLQAGTYGFSESMGTGKIADMIANGEVSKDLITILSGQTLAEIRQNFIKSGFKVNEVDAALQADQYRGSYPALADNPPGASLEGFLYPDSYQKTADTNPKSIVEAALQEMQEHLTTDIRNGFTAQGLTVYQGVTLASIVEKEVANQTDRTQVAQVFLKRQRQGMMLGSDVTVFYARSVNDPAYDTTERKGLPPGPISTVDETSLNAVAHPANTGWLYFVSGDDGTTHFSNTFEEHQQNIDKYCHKLCKS